MEPWPFTDPPNVATVTMRQVVHGGAPVLLVSHDADDGGWQFLSGGTFEVADGLLVSLRSMVERDPGLAELADLALGWEARREQAGSAWVRRLAAPST